MKKTHQNLAIILFFAALTACSGSSTQYVDYATPVDNTPKLDMKAAIYQAVLPSGNTLTITTDQSGTAVYGAYTVKNTVGTILSSGKVDNLVTRLELVGHPKSLCDAMSIVPSDINSNSDGAVATISGISCSETLPIKSAINRYTSPASTPNVMYSQGAINSANQVLEVSVASGDNVNFVGSITLEDRSLPALATGTIVGTITNSSDVPSTNNTVVEINNPTAFGFVFNRTTNFSGHFMALNDNLSAVSGYVRTSLSPLPGQYFINEIGVSVTNNGLVTQLGPVSVPFATFPAMLSYTLQ